MLPYTVNVHKCTLSESSPMPHWLGTFDCSPYTMRGDATNRFSISATPGGSNCFGQMTTGTCYALEFFTALRRLQAAEWMATWRQSYKATARHAAHFKLPQIKQIFALWQSVFDFYASFAVLIKTRTHFAHTHISYIGMYVCIYICLQSACHARHSCNLKLVAHFVIRHHSWPKCGCHIFLP